MGFLSWIRDKFTAPRELPDGPAIVVDAMDAETEDAELAERNYGPLSKNAFDGVSNWMTGQGGVGDPATATEYLYAATTDWQTLRNMCRVSWIARKIVWKKPRDMMRPGYSLVWEGSGDKPKGATETAADQVRRAITQKWDADNKIIEAMAWAREFGGAVIVIGIKGQQLDQALPVVNGQVDYSSIGKDGLESLLVFDRWRANHDGQIDDTPGSPNRGKPMFHVLAQDGGLVGQRVHWTRIIRFDGDKVDWWTWRANACWHDSVLQVVIDPLKQYDTLTSAISSLVPKARRDIVYAEDAAKNASTAEGRSAMWKRYQAVNSMAGAFKVAVYDMKKEKVEQQTFNFNGLDKIWEKSMREVGGGCGYPVSVLFDDQPSGLNADGEASQQNYYDDLEADRDSDIRPRQIALLECIVRNELGKLPPGFTITYNPFRTAGEVQKSQINLASAQADHIRIQDKVITPRGVARENKELSVYRTATQEDVDAAPEEFVAPVPMAPGGATKEENPAGAAVDPVPPKGAKAAKQKAPPEDEAP